MKLGILITAIASITIIESIALIQGIDGTVLAATIGAVAGLGGYHLRKSKRV